MSLKRFARSYAALLVCAPLLTVACGSDDDTSGSGGTGGTGGTSGGAAGTGGDGGTGNIANNGGTGNTGNTGGNGGTGNTGNTGGSGGSAGTTGGSAGTGGTTGGSAGTGGTTGGSAGTGGTTGGSAGTGGTTGGSAGTGGTTGGTGGTTGGTGGTTGGTGGTTGGTGGTTGGTGGTTGGTGGTTGGTGGTGGGTTVNLYFSEYIEGSGNFNKALEIYNAGDPIDLGTCSVLLYRNGAATAGTPIALTSQSLAAGGIWKLCVSDQINSGNTTCDQIDSGIDFNGDDGLELVCGGVTQDFFGQATGTDPGTGWGSPVVTANKTLSRKCTVTTGDKDGTDAFDPAVEWDVADQDTFTGFGTYTCP